MRRFVNGKWNEAEVIEARETVDVFREAATVLEAKKVEHSLDKVSERETPGLFPSQQVQDYLHKAKDGTGNRYFNWAILTNGNEWRLYCEQASTDAYFAFHLAHHRRKPCCHLDQGIVTCSVAILIVDRLEPVQIEEQYGKRSSIAMGACQGLTHPVGK